jgi:hypothetical protein
MFALPKKTAVALGIQMAAIALAIKQIMPEEKCLAPAKDSK